MRVLLSIALPHGHICASISSCSRLLLVYLVPLSSFRQVQVTYTKAQFRRFREVHWPVKIRFFSFLFLPSIPCISPSAFLIPPCFVALAFPFFLSLLLLLPCTFQTSRRTSPFLGFPLHPSILFNYAIPHFSSSPFRYFLPYSSINYYCWQPLFGLFLTLYCHFNFLVYLFVLSGCITSSVLNTVLLVVPMHLRICLAAAICTVSNCFTSFAFPSHILLHILALVLSYSSGCIS